MQTVKADKNSLVGARFGMLTVIAPAGSDKHGKRLWLCRCDCGAEKNILGANLLNGHSKSCGCTRQRDLTGKRVGRLTVLERTELTSSCGKRRTYLWKCLCDCGEYVYRPTDKLTDGTECMCEACAEKHAAERMRENAGYVGGTQISRIRTDRPIATNSSGVRGVYFDRRTGRWRARLKFKGKLMNFGSYADFNDAVRARRQAEEEYYGEFLKENAN